MTSANLPPILSEGKLVAVNHQTSQKCTISNVEFLIVEFGASNEEIKTLALNKHLPVLQEKFQAYCQEHHLNMSDYTLEIKTKTEGIESTIEPGLPHENPIGKDAVAKVISAVRAQLQPESHRLFISAIEEGNLSRINELIALGADINAKNDFNQTALHIAAEQNKAEMVDKLIQHGALIESFDYFTPLYVAAGKGNLESVKCLLAHQANPNLMQHNIASPLHHAVEKGEIEVAKSLVEHGADIDIATAEGKRPIHFAIEQNHLDIVKYLLNQGARLDESPNTSGSPDRIPSPLHFAAQRGNVEIVKLLLKANADPNSFSEVGETPLHAAARSGAEKIFAQLLRYNADPNLQSPTRQGLTPFHYVASKGLVSCFKTLIAEGANPTLLTNDGESVFHLAANHASLLGYLSQLGIDFTLVNNQGNTALHSAADVANEESVALLIGLGMNVNITNHQGYCPLHVALAAGSNTNIELLLKHGANPNARTLDDHTSTPLHMAILQGRADRVALLLKYGADKTIQNNDGLNALAFAQQYRRRQIVKLLI